MDASERTSDLIERLPIVAKMRPFRLQARQTSMGRLP